MDSNYTYAPTLTLKKFDINDRSTWPSTYGRYLVCRDGKVHFEVFNGTGWAYNHNSITHYYIADPPLSKHKQKYSIAASSKIAKAVLRPHWITSPDGKDVIVGAYEFYCPGCKHCHTYQVAVPNSLNWSFNGDCDRPTFTPSLLNTMQTTNGTDKVCHLFVTDGKIVYCGDCTHEYAGQTVEMVDLNNN